LTNMRFASSHGDWWWLLSPRAGHKNCPPKLKIVDTYRHDHSLERAWGALSGGTISFSIQPFSRKKSIFWIFLKKTSAKRTISSDVPVSIARR
jgi:hypothetical protein